MDAVGLDCIGDVLLLEALFAKVHEAIEHPQGIVISPNIETLLVESINSSVVTVKPRLEQINPWCSINTVRV